MSKYPSHKEIFASTKIETYSTKDIAFPPAFWPFIFIMNSFDGRNSELYFDREGNLLFDTKKDFESDWAILRKLPWTAYFKKSGEDYDFIIESMEDPTKKCIFPKNSSQYREAIIDMFIRFVVLDKYDDWH